MTTTGIVTLYTTLPTQEAAESLAKTLISERVAACVTIVPGATSVYRWEGKVKAEPEVVVLVKTSKGMSVQTFLRITELHPNALPAIVQWPIDAAFAPYEKWIKDQLV